MTTMTLVVGLIQMFGAAGLCLMPLVLGEVSLGLTAVYVVAGVTNGLVGVNTVLESLFGDDGLICPLFGKVNADNDD